MATVLVGGAGANKLHNGGGGGGGGGRGPRPRPRRPPPGVFGRSDGAPVVGGGGVAKTRHRGGEGGGGWGGPRGLQRPARGVGFAEQTAPPTGVDEEGPPPPSPKPENRRYFDAVMAEFGLTERASLL